MKEATKKIVTRLKKLMALRDGAMSIGNIHEAEAAALAINKILTEYNVAMYTGEDEIKDEPIIGERAEQLNIRYEQFSRSLMASICKYNYCTSLLSFTAIDKKITVIGDEVNVQTCWYLHSFLSNNFIHNAKINAKSIALMSKKKSYIEAFLQGCVIGLSEKLQNEQNATTHALIKYNSEAVTLYLKTKNLMPKRKRQFGAASTLKDYAAFSSGYEHGRTVSINSGLTNSTDNKELQ